MPDYRLKGASGAVFGQSWALAGECLIGRAAHCAIRLDEDAAGDEHALLEVSPQRVMLVQLDPERDTFVNGEKVERQALGQGDEIRIGRSRFLLQAPGLKPERVLHTDTAPKRTTPWTKILLSAAVLAAAAAAAWYFGLIPGL